MDGALYMSAKEWGRYFCVSAFNHERTPMSCLQQLDGSKANNWTNNNGQWSHQQLRSQVLMAHNTHYVTASMVQVMERRISYVSVRRASN